MKTKKFVEVEIRGNEKEHKPDDSTYYFKCETCFLPAQATNGHLILKDPKDPMGDPKGFEVDYLYCHTCDVLENMKDMDFEKQVFYTEATPHTPEQKVEFTKKVRLEVFK